MPLKVSDGLGAWIKDFQKSDAPQFKGKSDKERQAQAVAAYLSAKRGPQKEDSVKELSYKTMNRYHSAAQRSKDRATNSAVATILRKGDHSKDLQTRNKRDKGMAMAKSRTIDKIRKGIKEDMTFKVDIEGLPALFISGNSPGQVKNHLRKLIKQPSMIKSVDRQTKHDVKKMYRKKAQGKGLDEDSPIAVNELSPDMMKSYKKAASDSNYKAASKYARIARSPTGKKYKDKEMAKQDNIMRKRKAGLAMADKRESTELGERTPIRPTIKDKKLKNLRVPNPNYKGSLDRKPKQKRAMHAEGSCGDVDYGSDKSIRIMKKKTPGEANEKMTFAKVRGALYKTAKAMGDVQAVRKKKVGKRVARRVAGKAASRILRNLIK